MVYFPHFEEKCVDSLLGGHPVEESSGLSACCCHHTLLFSRPPGQGGLPANREWYLSWVFWKAAPKSPDARNLNHIHTVLKCAFVVKRSP